MTNMKQRHFVLLVSLMSTLFSMSATPIAGLLDRIDKGASRKFVTELIPGDTCFFEIASRDGKVLVRGNDYVSIASGINWYLKYHLGILLTWNNMHAQLPEHLPLPVRKERHVTTVQYRYYLNYCTFSYSMAFWDWKRWEQEIDWMALHGINLSLDLVGTDVVWRNLLRRLGYRSEEIARFIAGPAFQAWWLMNNMEGWGGPNPENWYQRQERLQRKIMVRMKDYGIHPVLPGYSGMVPHDARQRLALSVADPGKWCGYQRPAFLLPTDGHFDDIASKYYEEQRKLYGTADFYAMDPFHEGGNVSGVDLAAAGDAIMQSMKKVNPSAVWIVQSWQNCPYPSMIRHLPKGDLLVLDLYSESCPQWGDPDSPWYRKEGFNGHDWSFCMLLNYGGNVGLFGKMQHVIDEYFKARQSPFAPTMKGVGLTMEGIENNPVMYELVTELPWHNGPFSKEEWLRKYVLARYGYRESPKVQEAWRILSQSIYDCPGDVVEQGCHESVFCARPSLDAYQVSTWSQMVDYYDPEDVIRAARLMIEAADDYRGNKNYEYDLVDVVRQALAERGRCALAEVKNTFRSGDAATFNRTSKHFLDLLLAQDRLLGTMSDFTVGRWLQAARAMGKNTDEQDLYEWNARVQITTWGNRIASEDGGLHDYAHKEWNGLLRDVYYPRWRRFFAQLGAELNGEKTELIDYYSMDEQWTLRHDNYSSTPVGNPVDVAREVMSFSK